MFDYLMQDRERVRKRRPFKRHREYEEWLRNLRRTRRKLMRGFAEYDEDEDEDE